jgi:recombinational DNA repair protein (RecF pathway)
MLKEKTIPCDACNVRIAPEDIYRYQARRLCSDCCMEARLPRTRKVHWQYLKSIKADYLRYPKKEVRK